MMIIIIIIMRMIRYNQTNLDILNTFHVNASTYYYVISENIIMKSQTIIKFTRIKR